MYLVTQPFTITFTIIINSRFRCDLCVSCERERSVLLPSRKHFISKREATTKLLCGEYLANVKASFALLFTLDFMRIVKNAARLSLSLQKMLFWLSKLSCYQFKFEANGKPFEV